MEYKGYIGTVEYDEDAEIFHGEVINLKDVITFRSDSVSGLKREFRESIDDYLEFCSARKEEAEKPFSGKLTLRLTPELHRKLYIRSRKEKKSLNHWINETLEKVS